MTNQKEMNNKLKRISKAVSSNIGKVSHKVIEIKESECRSNNLVGEEYRPSRRLPSGVRVLVRRNSSTSRTTIPITMCGRFTNFKNSWVVGTLEQSGWRIESRSQTSSTL